MGRKPSIEAHHEVQPVDRLLSYVARISCSSSSVRQSGFSIKTCLFARSDLITREAWLSRRVPIRTLLIVVSSKIDWASLVQYAASIFPARVFADP